MTRTQLSTVCPSQGEPSDTLPDFHGIPLTPTSTPTGPRLDPDWARLDHYQVPTSPHYTPLGPALVATQPLLGPYRIPTPKPGQIPARPLSLSVTCKTNAAFLLGALTGTSLAFDKTNATTNHWVWVEGFKVTTGLAACRNLHRERVPASALVWCSTSIPDGRLPFYDTQLP